MKFVIAANQPRPDFEAVYCWEVRDREDNVLAQGPTNYRTEPECRRAIAKARKAFAGARFAKVVYDEDLAELLGRVA